MSKINDVFNQYMELEKVNNQIDRDLQAKGDEFEDITKEIDQSIVAVFLGQLLSEPEYNKATKFFKKVLPFSVGLIVVLNIILNSLFVPGIVFDFPSVLISLSIYFGLSFAPIKDRIKVIKKYHETEERLNSYNSGVISRLRDLKEFIKSLDEQKKTNEEKMKELEAEVVRLLALEMESEYRKHGIEEEIEIDQATIVANTKNRLELTFNKGGHHE